MARLYREQITLELRMRASSQHSLTPVGSEGLPQSRASGDTAGSGAASSARPSHAGSVEGLKGAHARLQAQHTTAMSEVASLRLELSQLGARAAHTIAMLQAQLAAAEARAGNHATQDDPAPQAREVVETVGAAPPPGTPVLSSASSSAAATPEARDEAASLEQRVRRLQERLDEEASRAQHAVALRQVTARSSPAASVRRCHLGACGPLHRPLSLK